MFNRMRKKHVVGGITAVVILIVAFFVIWGAWRNTRNEIPVLLDNPTKVYDASLDLLESATDLFYRANVSRQATTGSTILEEQISQRVTLQGGHTDKPKYRVEESTIVGDYDFQQTLFYANHVAYANIQGSFFQSEMQEDAFLRRIIPVSLIDTTLYSEITGFRTNKTTRISFSGATALESWVSQSDAQVTNAGATIIINENGELIGCEYRAEYSCGDVNFVYHLETEISRENITPVILPDSSQYTQIDNLSTPYLLERSAGYLLNAANIRAEYRDFMSCEAFGDERSQSVILETGIHDAWYATIDTSISLSNTSKVGVVSTTTRKEQYTNGLYSLSTNGGEFVAYPDISKDTMVGYCENLLVGTIILPEHIANSVIEETNDLFCITFQANEPFAQLLAQETCSTLYNDKDVLTQVDPNPSTDIITCYLNISKTTGFPVSSGFHYKGTYTISGLPYTLTFQADQTYTLTQ